ncbi:hypothetical protein NL533_32830, partial [Klebsiella pneumoniae]|nr:hypothetical protein [Klebsiella pneumoniae]
MGMVAVRDDSQLKLFVLSTLLLSVFAPSSASCDDVYSGNQMYAHCGATKNNPVVNNFTLAYISGVLNTLQLVQ